MPVKWILALSCVPVFVTAAFAAAFYRRLDRQIRAFAPFLFVSGAVQLVSLGLWWFSIPNNFLLHVYVMLGFCCIAWFYGVVLEGFVSRSAIFWLMAVFISLSAVNLAFLQGWSTFDSNGLTAEAIVVIIFAMSTMLLSQNEAVSERQRNAGGLNWINGGLLIFYASAILLFYFGDIINQYYPKYQSRYSWLLHAFFSVTMYCCFLAGLWKSRVK
jgi:hypothetical protein